MSAKRTLYRAVAADYELQSSNGSAGASGLTLSGRFAVYDHWTEINSMIEEHFLERISSGAFTKTIRERGSRLPVLFSHGKDPTIGLMTLGTVRELVEDAEGVRYEVDLFPGLPDLLVEGLRAGSYGASFRAKLMQASSRGTIAWSRSEYRKLDDPIVLQFPQSFSVVIRVDQLDRSLDEIERDAAA
jgi:phage head maturation protease